MKDPQKLIRVRDVMKTDVDIVDGVITVADALRRMKHVGNRAVLVDKRHADDEYGILLLADIARLVLACDKSPDRVNVYEIMSKPVLGIHPAMDIRYCARMFEKFGLSLAPVIEEGNVVGMVSYNDLVLKGMVPGL
jgi:CBS domain-containing protein